MKNVTNVRPFAFNLYVNDKDFSFIKTPEEILKELINSKENGNAIGINAPPLGAGMFITGVEDIVLEETDTIILLKSYDMSGYILPCTRILLTEIISICPFKSEFKNPFLDTVDKEKTWFF